MANIQIPIRNAGIRAERAVRQQAPALETIARIGFLAKGVVYIVIGFLALEAAFSNGGKTTNSQGALENIVQQPFGRFLLGIVGIGLAAYALWRFVQAGLDTENKDSDATGVLTRIGFILSGIAYGALAVTALRILRGTGGSGSQTTQDWTIQLMAHPVGPWLIGLLGLIVIGLACGQIVKGWKTKFTKHLAMNEMSARQKRIAVAMGKWGHIARGIVFFIMGGFLVEAALHTNPAQAKGLGSALDLLSVQSFGPILLGLVAAGLMAYGAYMFIEARWRRVSL